MTDEPVKRHPAADPSWTPKPRKKVLGIAVPSLKPPPEDLRIELKDDGHAEVKSPHALWVTLLTKVFAPGGTLVVIFTLWLKLKAPEAEPAEITQQCATQAAFDQLQARVNALEITTRKNGESICALNGGPLGTDWPECPPHVYWTPRETPPLKRTDRSYSK